jgi:Protein of unknown function (DUF3618)
MGQDPGEIREEIERTRDQMSQTADALAAKADVRSRTRLRVTEAKQKLIGGVRQRLPADRQEARERVRARLPATRSEAVQQAKVVALQAKTRVVSAKAAAQADPRGTALAAGSCAAVVGGLVALALYDRSRGTSPTTMRPHPKKATGRRRTPSRSRSTRRR